MLLKEAERLADRSRLYIHDVIDVPSYTSGTHLFIAIKIKFLNF
jgi:hypothetical protein